MKKITFLAVALFLLGSFTLTYTHAFTSHLDSLNAPASIKGLGTSR